MNSSPQPPARTGRRRLLIIALIAGVAVLALAWGVGLLLSDRSEGDLDAGDTDIAVDVPERHLAHGACVESLEYVIDDVLRQVPCAVRHHAQVVATQEITDAEYDGPSAYTRQAEEFCLPAAYRLIPEDVDAGPLSATFLVPSRSSWDEGDRTIRCVLGVPDDHHLTGSFLAGDVQVHDEPM